MDTTIQVSTEVAQALKQLFPGATYDSGIKALVKTAIQPVSHSMNFKQELQPLTPAHEDHTVPFDAIITDVLMSFPSGCRFLVDVRVLYMENNRAGPQYVMPSIENQYIALNNADPHWRNLNFPVKKNGIVSVEWNIHDDGAPDNHTHTIPVEVTMTGARG